MTSNGWMNGVIFSLTQSLCLRLRSKASSGFILAVQSKAEATISFSIIFDLPNSRLKSGQVNVERRALTRFTLDQDLSFTLFDNAITGG